MKRLALPTVATFLAIGFYAILTASSRRFLPFQRELYFGTVAVVVFFVLTRLLWGKMDGRIVATGIAWVGVFALPILPVLLQRRVHLNYVVGDFALLVVPVIFLFFFRAYPAAASKSALRVLLGLLLAAAVYAHISYSLRPIDDRPREPETLLIALAWATFACSNRGAERGVMGLVVFGVLILGILTTQRANVLLWSSCLILLIFLWNGLQVGTARLSKSLSIAFVAVVLAGAASAVLASESAQFRRFQNVESDESVVNRFDEVRDAYDTAMLEWVPLNYVLGGGYGATFIPQESASTRNFLDDNSVHNLHIGPAMIVYRLGSLGLLFYVGWFFLSVRTIVRARDRIAKKSPDAIFFTAIGLASLLQFAEFHFFNNLNNLLTAVTMGGLLAINAVGMHDRAAMGPPTSLPIESKSSLTSGASRE